MSDEIDMPHSIIQGLNTRKRAAGAKVSPDPKEIKDVRAKVDPLATKAEPKADDAQKSSSVPTSTPRAKAASGAKKKAQVRKPSKEQTMTERVSFRIEKSLHDEMDAIAKERKWKISELQRYIVEGWLKENKQRYL